MTWSAPPPLTLPPEVASTMPGTPALSATQTALPLRSRSSHPQVQAAQGAEEVILPLVPFRGWTANEQVSKGDICYLVYREEPWDVSFRFVPYQEFPS